MPRVKERDFKPESKILACMIQYGYIQTRSGSYNLNIHYKNNFFRKNNAGGKSIYS